MPFSPSTLSQKKQVGSAIPRHLESTFEYFSKHTSSIIFVKDKQGRYVVANDTAANWLGTTVDEMLGKTDRDLFPPEVAQAIQSADRQVLETTEPLEYEETVVQSGEKRKLSTKKIPWIDSSNLLLGLIGICRDITDDKESDTDVQRIEAELLNRLTEIEYIYQTAPVGLSVLDEKLRFQKVNQHFADINKTTADEHIGRSVREVIPYLADKVEPLLHSVLETGTPLLNVEVDYETSSQPGVLRTRIESWYPLKSANGAVNGINVVCQETTALKRAEEDRDHFFELSRDMLAVANTEGYFIRVNSAWTKVLGYSQQEMLSRPYLDFVHPEDRSLTEKTASALSQGKPTIGFENRYRCKDGSYCWLEWSVTPFPQRNVLYAVAHDVTSRKQAQIEREKLLLEAETARDEAERANQLKDDFLAVLSHELRTPLNPILGWAQILKQKGLGSERAQSGLAAIERNARLQIQLVDDLLDVSRILRGKLALQPQSINLAEVVINAIETVRLAAEAKYIQIETDFQTQLCSVNGDSGRLQQVVWNLLSNAVKFTPEGGLVTVHLRQVNNSIQLQIIDTGKGIDPEFLPYVFDRFRQADGTTTRQFGGLGLGLAIASKILEMHGSTIAVDSPGEGQGATFTITMPALATKPETANSITPPMSQEVELLLSGLQLLIIDDEPDSLEIGSVILEQFGASVTAVSSAPAAFEVLSNVSFDGIICDIGMPDIDGYQFIKTIRAMEIGNIRSLPAIALTAYAGTAEKERALAAGFQAHIAKPVDSIKLAQQVLQLCKSSEG